MTAVSLSQWAQDLIDHLGHHMDSERDALSAYQDLAERAGDPRVEQLARHIVSDEIRHHQQFEEIRLALREEIEQRQPRDTLPRLGEEERAELLQRTEELLALEREDVKELKQLSKQLRSVADTEWRAAVVDAMEMDNRKHILLLERIRALLR